MTRFGGVGLLRRFFEKRKLRKQLETVSVRDRRNSDFSPAQMCMGMLYALMLGIFRPSQMMELVRDKVFQSVAKLRKFPVQSTISRFLDKVTVHTALQIAEINSRLLNEARESFKKFKALTWIWIRMSSRSLESSTGPTRATIRKREAGGAITRCFASSGRHGITWEEFFVRSTHGRQPGPILIILFHLMACIALIAIVLLKTGKGAEMGAAFGGASQTLFGGSGGSSFMSKLTTGAAVVFMITCLLLSFIYRPGVRREPVGNDRYSLGTAPGAAACAASASNS